MYKQSMGFDRRLCRCLFAVLACAAAWGITPVHAEEITVTVDAKASAGRMSTWFEPGAFAAHDFGNYVAPGTDFVGDFIRDAGGSTSGAFRLSVELSLAHATSLDDYRKRLRERKQMADICRRIEQAGAQLMIMVFPTPYWARTTTRGKGSGKQYAPRENAWNQWEDAVYETVRYFNGELGLKNVWYEFWNEPDVTTEWNDSPDRFFRMWQVFYRGAKRADSKARVGGCPTNWFRAPFGFQKGGVPILKQFLEFSKRNGMQVDFVSPHYFQPNPDASRAEARLVQSWLNENGYPNALIIVGESNPRDLMLKMPWPSPPTALKRVTDAEMAAPYVLTLMQGLQESGSKGYLCYALTSPDHTADYGTDDPDGGWGSRTHGKLNAIRMAVYHGLTIAGRMKRSLVSATVQDPHAQDEIFPHFHALSGADGTTLTILMWNFVTNPVLQTNLKMREMLGPERGRTLMRELKSDGDEGNLRTLADLFDGKTPANRLRLDAETQGALNQARRYYQRQEELVTEEHDVSLKLANFPSSTGYQLTRYLVDATHSNSYYYFVKAGIEAAKQHQMLETVDSRHIRDLSEIGKIRLAPYSVTLLTLEAGGGAAEGRAGRENTGSEVVH